MGKVVLKRGQDEEGAASLSKFGYSYPNLPLADDAFFSAGRIYQINKEFDKALNLYDYLYRHYPESEFRDEVIWNMGWIYYRSGGYLKAATTFEASSSDEALYWRARSLEKLGRKEEAEKIYNTLVKKSPPSYYSYLAHLRSGLPLVELSSRNSRHRGSTDQETTTRKKRAELLIELGTLEDALQEIGEMEKEAGDNYELWDVSLLYREAGDFPNSIRIGKTLFGVGISGAMSLVYPRGFRQFVTELAEGYGIDEYLVYAIIREESYFQDRVVSSAGAVGLMQIMPGTGKAVARKIGMINYSSSFLYLPDINVDLGIYYFREMLDKFWKVTSYALAAYNAGPGRVVRWLNKFGELETDEFVEEIPYKETRKYTKRVLKSYAIYKSIYEDGSRKQ